MNRIFTARKRSLGQGNMFTPVCHSVHREVYLVPGGVLSPRGVYLILGGVLSPGGHGFLGCGFFGVGGVFFWGACFF